MGACEYACLLCVCVCACVCVLCVCVYVCMIIISPHQLRHWLRFERYVCMCMCSRAGVTVLVCDVVVFACLLKRVCSSTIAS